MRKIQGVLGLKYELGPGHRAIAAPCAMGKASVCDYLSADKAGLIWTADSWGLDIPSGQVLRSRGANVHAGHLC
jgi:hypothetical protein